MKIKDEWVARASDAVLEHRDYHENSLEDDLRIVIAAVAPLITVEVIDECQQAAEDEAEYWYQHDASFIGNGAYYAARRIRTEVPKRLGIGIDVAEANACLDELVRIDQEDGDYGRQNNRAPDEGAREANGW